MAIPKLRLYLMWLFFDCLVVLAGHSFRGIHRCHYFNNDTYLLSKKNLNWDQTANYCTRFRGRFPIPRNKQQMDFLSSRIDWKGFKIERYWIGLTINNVLPGWHWIDGSALNFSNWNTGRPFFDTFVLPDCAYVNVLRHHKWEDMTCIENKDITVVCRLEGHAWSSWSTWSDCNCSSYIQQRTRVCGSSVEARVICPCPGNDTQKQLCSCLTRWKEFQKDNSGKNHFSLVKNISAESLVVCSMICLQEKSCSRFAYPGQNICNLYKKTTSSPVSAALADTIDAYIVVDEGQWTSSIGFGT